MSDDPSPAQDPQRGPRRMIRSSNRRAVLRGLDNSSIMGAELFTATLTWAGLGWLLDRWLGTEPWFLAIGALLGSAAGLYLVWLRAGRMDAVEAQEAG